jgi:hypothetical protein
MSIIKCRFCHFLEDDPDRTFNIDRKLLKSTVTDFYYNTDTGNLTPAVYESDYAVITCPTLKCEKLMIADRKELGVYLVKTIQTNDYDFIPYRTSLYLNDLKESYKIMCHGCKYINEEPNYERVAFVSYSNMIQTDPSDLQSDGKPILVVSCTNRNCMTGFMIPEPEKHLSGIIELEPSQLLATLQIKPRYTGKPDWDPQTESFSDKIKHSISENSESIIKNTLLETLLSSLVGHRVSVIDNQNNNE